MKLVEAIADDVMVELSVPTPEAGAVKLVRAISVNLGFTVTVAER